MSSSGDPVALVHIALTAEEAVFSSADGPELTLRFPRPGQVSVGWGGALAEPSYAVVAGSAAAAPAVEDTVDGWRVIGPGIGVDVARDGKLTYLDATDRVRRSERAPVRWGEGWASVAQLPDGASVHGLGGRSLWQLQGRTWRCWNTDPGGAWRSGDDPLSVTTPVYAALDDLGAVHCFIDNPWDATIEVTVEEVRVDFVGGPARWHITVGGLPECLEAYTALTGRPVPVPRWALGHHQARWGYGSSEAVREVWRKFREHRLPLSSMHLDIDHMDRHRDFTAGSDFADLDALVAEMADDDVRTVVIVDAGVAKAEDYPQYLDGLQRGVFCRTAEGEVYEGEVWPGPTVFPDFTAEDVRQWWGDQFRAYTDIGVAGFWHDMNEPVIFADEGEATFPLDTRHDLDGRGGDHRAAHNIYGLQMCRATYEGLLQADPARRPFLFSRSGWAGLQRYGGNWSGDIGTEWASLQATIHQAFAFGISGIGYYGPDIGGFTGDPSPELFTRWFQLASFLPFFRTHCAFNAPRREPWEWGEEVMGHLREALLRRYRLLPYWYTLVVQSARDGSPSVRPLAWQDPALRAVDDVFLVGSDLLVAPVLHEAARVRSVDLPPGGWFHGETGQRYEGRVEVPVGVDDTPWFVRAGAVIPTEEDGRLVLLAAPVEWEGERPSGLLLADSGDGWSQPHEERYHSALMEGRIVVRREVVVAGPGEPSDVAVRSLGGGPADLI